MPKLILEPRATTLYHECRVCDQINGPSVLEAVFDRTEDGRAWRIWGLCCLSHTRQEIEAAYIQWQKSQARY